MAPPPLWPIKIVASIQINFAQCTYASHQREKEWFPLTPATTPSQLSLYMANSLPQLLESILATISHVVQKAAADPDMKADLQALLLGWPSVCTYSLGQTRIIMHHICTDEEIPIWKISYPILIHKQQIVEEVIAKMLELELGGVLYQFILPWVLSVVQVGKKFASISEHTITKHH